MPFAFIAGFVVGVSVYYVTKEASNAIDYSS